MSGAAGSGAGAGAGSSMASKKEAAKALLKTGWLKTRSVLTNKSKIELLVEDSTNLEPWGPTGQQMNEISDACFDAEKFKQAWGVILKRFESDPDQWRRIYKALLLTEHLLKNSSQHVVQTIIDAVGVLEGLKQFKYLDEKNKDQGINVSNRAKELLLLVGNPDRIRSERMKAKSLKEKFKGASREEMAAAASGYGYTSASTAGWTSSGGTCAGSASSGWDAASGGSSRGTADSLQGFAAQRSSVLPAGDDGHLGEEGPALGGEARPGKGYGALPPETSSPSAAVTATAQRIASLRAKGLLQEEQAGGGSSSSANAGAPGTSRPMARPSSESCLAGATGSGMAGTHSYDDLTAAPSGGSQTTSKPSLQELMARRAGPKKLQEVRVNPAIASTVAALGGSSGIKPAATAAAGGAPAGAASPSKPAAPVALAPPPAPAPASPASKHVSASGSTAGGAAFLADMLGGPAPPAAGASHSPLAASSGGSSPWSTSSPARSVHPPADFDAFGPTVGTMGPMHSGMPATASLKQATSSPGVINLTASAAAASNPASNPPALPAYLFAEPTPPAYTSATGWGTHVAGAAPAPGQAQRPASMGSANPFAAAGSAVASPKPAAAADNLFADFSPFK